MSHKQTSTAQLHGLLRFVRRWELLRETTYTAALKRSRGRPDRRLHFRDHIREILA